MSGIIKEPYLSICIPTYNQENKVYSLVTDILTCKSNEIEVVVLDNCSTDNTKKVLNEISDSRFVFKQNSENIGSKLNSVNVLKAGRGNFVLLCLDKDIVVSHYIPIFLKSLKDDSNIALGYCVLEVNENEGNGVIYRKGFDSVYNMAFLSKHPSGNFYSSSILKQLNFFEELKNNFFDFDFYHELINAEACLLGRSKKINLPLISAGYLHEKEELALEKTHTFTSENYFCSPPKRIAEYSTYFIRSSMLSISKTNKRRLYSAIYFRGLIRITWSYRNALSDFKNCMHYGITPRKVTYLELLKYDVDYTIAFLKLNIPVNFLSKIFICVYGQIKLLSKLIVFNYKKK